MAVSFLVVQLAQILVHFRLMYSAKCLRLRIMYLCLAQYVITFVHYGWLGEESRERMDPVIDINKFHISFCLFYFYLDKASGLLPNQSQVLKRLNTAYKVCCLLLYIVMIVFEIMYQSQTTESLYILLVLSVFKAIPIILFLAELKVLLSLRPSVHGSHVDVDFLDVI